MQQVNLFKVSPSLGNHFKGKRPSEGSTSSFDYLLDSLPVGNVSSKVIIQEPLINVSGLLWTHKTI